MWICRRVGKLSRGIWAVWIDGLIPMYEVQQGKVPGPVPVPMLGHNIATGCAEWLGSSVIEKDGGAGQQLAETEPTVCPGRQEGQWHGGLGLLFKYFTKMHMVFSRALSSLRQNTKPFAAKNYHSRRCYNFKIWQEY